MTTLGVVQSIWRYPIKSLASQSLREAKVCSDGIAGDRVRALIVKEGHARAGKTYRGKENNLLHTTDSSERARELAASKSARVEIHDGEARYFDAAPISLIFDRWLEAASRLVGYRLEPLRFRPNLYAFSSAEFCDDEVALVGARLCVGEAVLLVREPIERCVTPTYDLQTGDPDPNVLRAIAQHRAACLGIYCDVLSPGRVSTGNAIVRQ